MNNYLRRNWSSSFKRKISYSTPLIPLYFPVSGLECEPTGQIPGIGFLHGNWERASSKA